MFAQITRLQHWKSEHTAETCQDRFKDDPAQGLFAVADGAGTTSFPRLWAGVLVEHFLEVPLLGTDPFEVEWWVRLAQEKYEQVRPELARLDYTAREKEIRTGSESTLVTLRLTEVGPEQVQGVLLAFGDSCVFVLRPGQEQVESFPLKKAADFERSPVCVPSNAGVFHRQFHKCVLEAVSVEAGSTLILATDAVAKWLISAGNGEYATVREAFQAVASCRPDEEWGRFVEERRKKKKMVDDDCTALVIGFQDGYATREEWSGVFDEGLVQVGVREQPHQTVLEARRAAFEAAQTQKDWEAMAVSWGDGQDLAELQEQGKVTPEEIEHARRVADALKEVISTSAAYYKKPEFVGKLREVWNRHKELLEGEPRAATIKKTLEDNGVFREVTPAPQQYSPSSLAMLAARREAERVVPPAPLMGEALPPTVVMAQLPVVPPAAAAPEGNGLPVRPLSAPPQPEELPVSDQALLDQFDNALRLGNEPDMLALYEQLKLRGSAPTNPQDVLRVQLAQQRQQALGDFRLTLQGAEPGAVVAARNAVEEAGCGARITEQEERQVRLAARFLQALHEQDDEGLVLADEERQSASFPQFLRFTKEQEDRLALARARQRALAEFRAAVQSRQLQQIALTFMRVHDVGPMRGMTPEERELGDLATLLRAALAQRTDEVLAEAYSAYQRSRYRGQLAFVEEELDRMRQAQERAQQEPDPTMVLARIRFKKGMSEITAGGLKKAQAVRRLYLMYRIGELQQRAASAPSEQIQQFQQRILDLRAELASPDAMQARALEELIDDVLIQQGMALEQAEGVSGEWFQVPRLQETLAAILGMPGEARYREFLQDARLTDAEAVALVGLYLRRRRFQFYLSRKPEPEGWESWIAGRRKKVEIEYAAARAAPKKRRLLPGKS